MDTVDQLSAYCAKNHIEDISIMGAPKTIDNDLVGTDHCPGFGSAAKYIAATFSELERDCHVYTMKAVTIVEVMGRNAGWLTAASALSRLGGGKGPNLIYLCETDFDNDRFIEDVKQELENCDSVVVAISEGIKDKEGRYVSEQVQTSAVDNPKFCTNLSVRPNLWSVAVRFGQRSTATPPKSRSNRPQI